MPTENISKQQLDLTKLIIEPLDHQTDRAAFCCGKDPIDNFCRINAKKQHTQNKVRVYDAIYDGQLVAYYYLVAASRPPETISKAADEKFGRVGAAPCIYLGMVGVHQKLQGHGLGKILMLHAMEATLKVADIIGLYALTLDAIDKETAEFYKKMGFEFFIDGELAMFIPLTTIRDALQG